VLITILRNRSRVRSKNLPLKQNGEDLDEYISRELLSTEGAEPKKKPPIDTYE